MTMGLTGGFSCNNLTWSRLLKLAYKNGWQPAGTELPTIYDEIAEQRGEPPPDNPDWDGGYMTNDGQWVTDADAAAIADALSEVLDDIPDCETVALETIAKRIEKKTGRPYTGLNGDTLVYATEIPDNLFDFFGGRGKQRVIDFIAHCRRGGFAIY